MPPHIFQPLADDTSNDPIYRLLSLNATSKPAHPHNCGLNHVSRFPAETCSDGAVWCLKIVIQSNPPGRWWWWCRVKHSSPRASVSMTRSMVAGRRRMVMWAKFATAKKRLKRNDARWYRNKQIKHESIAVERVSCMHRPRGTIITHRIVFK